MLAAAAAAAAAAAVETAAAAAAPAAEEANNFLQGAWTRARRQAQETLLLHEELREANAAQRVRGLQTTQTQRLQGSQQKQLLEKPSVQFRERRAAGARASHAEATELPRRSEGLELVNLNLAKLGKHGSKNRPRSLSRRVRQHTVNTLLNDPTARVSFCVQHVQTHDEKNQDAH